MDRAAALVLLKKYNHDRFHLQHALTVEGVMRYFSAEFGQEEGPEFWGNVGLLHDIDYEQFPEQHCTRAAELLREGGADDALIHAVCSHGWNLTVDVRPEHKMEKILYATDELTGLIWAVAIMRPSRSVQDLEAKSVKKKYKNKAFAAGCSREVIEAGAALLGWELEELIARTIDAMRSCEQSVAEELEQLTGT